MVCNKDSMRAPIYFGTVIWGRAFSESFVNNTLASLLAKGNIPSLDNNSGRNCFLICTTLEDRLWIEEQPLVILLKTLMKVQFLEMSLISETDYQKLNNSLRSRKLYTMTQGHLNIVARMHMDKAVGSIVLADSIYADRSIQSAYKYIIEGKKGVFVFCPRFSTEDIIENLIKQSYLHFGQPLTIEPRELVKIAMQSLHVDMLMEQWYAPYIPEFMMEAGWSFQDNSGMVFHTWSCWCAFIDYSQIKTHNSMSLGDNTVDGVYFGDNLDKEDIHLITDSDEFTLISYSPHIERRLVPMRMSRNRLSSKIICDFKTSYVRKFLKGEGNSHTDSFKINFATQPIFMHTKDLTHDCYSLAKKTTTIMKKVACKNYPIYDRIKLILYSYYFGQKKESIIAILKKILKYTAILSISVIVLLIVRPVGFLLGRLFCLLRIRKCNLNYIPVPQSYLENSAEN
ncbi:MAG: hypothetical protein P1U74_01710 [Legionellaceae bacterium]|nr:hypothetical protein [Legionellaceae bacterium]